MPIPTSKRKVRTAPKRKPPAGEAKGFPRGRPAFEPTERQRAMVKALSIAGFKQLEICKAIRNPDTNEPISKPTLELHFRDELDMAFFELAALTTQNFGKKLTGAPAQYHPETGKLLRKEVESETRAQMFFFNTRLKGEGWTTRHEVTGKDGAPLPANIGSMSDDQLDQFIARLEARGDPEGSPPRARKTARKTGKPRKSS